MFSKDSFIPFIPFFCCKELVVVFFFVISFCGFLIRLGVWEAFFHHSLHLLLGFYRVMSILHFRNDLVNL